MLYRVGAACLCLIAAAACTRPSDPPADPEDVLRAAEHAQLQADIPTSRPGLGTGGVDCPGR
jgi:hypothetical protein